AGSGAFRLLQNQRLDKERMSRNLDLPLNPDFSRDRTTSDHTHWLTASATASGTGGDSWAPYPVNPVKPSGCICCGRTLKVITPVLSADPHKAYRLNLMK